MYKLLLLRYKKSYSYILKNKIYLNINESLIKFISMIHYYFMNEKDKETLKKIKT